MLDWFSAIKKKPVKVFLTHGEENSLLAFSSLLKENFNIDVEIASIGETVEIETVEKSISILTDKPAVKSKIDLDLIDDIDAILDTIREALVNNSTLIDMNKARLLSEKMKNIRSQLENLDKLIKNV